MSRWLSIFLLALLGLGTVAAQPFAQETYPPAVTAANELWQINGDPILSEGFVYRAAGPTVFFDGNVMARSGVYKGIPVYQDRMLEPYSALFVPIGGNLMREYERDRVGELAGTSGSTASSVLPPQLRPPEAVSGVGTVGNLLEVSRTPSLEPLSALAASADTGPKRLESIPPPSPGFNGIWVQFDGRRWLADGGPEPYNPDRFEPAGLSSGAVVYRERSGSSNRIWVPVVTGDLLTPYSTR